MSFWMVVVAATAVVVFVEHGTEIGDSLQSGLKRLLRRTFK